MVLNALNMDPQRQWRGSVWRWYSEEMVKRRERGEGIHYII